jgi:SAM-dependent methyltransferase
LELIRGFAKAANAPAGLSVNIGCKETSDGDVNLDISGHPDVRASALFLPFKPDAFSLAIFTEVLEHLPWGKESQAISEIRRVLGDDGVLILSTPTSQGLWGKFYWICDPTFWLIGHRHYNEPKLRQLLHQSGFSIEVLTRRGGTRDLLFSLITPLAYAIRKLGVPCDPNLKSDYSSDSPKRGYTFVVRARKLDLGKGPSSSLKPSIKAGVPTKLAG